MESPSAAEWATLLEERPWREKSLFPSPERADEEGALCLSDGLDCRLLLDAYYHGIFPWPFEEESILWASPPLRGVLPLSEFHIPKTLKREWKKSPFTVRIDTCFPEVMAGCAQALRPGEEGTWITGMLQEAFLEFHRLGYAHSFEAFAPDGTLAGGLYGVLLGKIFCGESMFYRQSGASKIAFCVAVEQLRGHGVTLVDTQMVTNLTASFGAREIPRREYLALLEEWRDDSPTPGIFPREPPLRLPPDRPALCP